MKSAVTAAACRHRLREGGEEGGGMEGEKMSLVR